MQSKKTYKQGGSLLQKRHAIGLLAHSLPSVKHTVYQVYLMEERPHPALADEDGESPATRNSLGENGSAAKYFVVIRPLQEQKVIRLYTTIEFLLKILLFKIKLKVSGLIQDFWTQKR